MEKKWYDDLTKRELQAGIEDVSYENTELKEKIFTLENNLEEVSAELENLKKHMF